MNSKAIFYELTYNMKKLGQYPTFYLAIAEWLKRLKKDIKEHGGISLQVLETAQWVEMKAGDRLIALFYFYDARDISYHLCLMTEDGYPVEISGPDMLNAEVKLRDALTEVLKPGVGNNEIRIPDTEDAFDAAYKAGIEAKIRAEKTLEEIKKRYPLER